MHVLLKNMADKKYDIRQRRSLPAKVGAAGVPLTPLPMVNVLGTAALASGS